MRAVVQRVAAASVEVEGRIVSAIGAGLLVLVGLHESDVDSDADYICRKVLNMRLFPNEKTGKNWDQNVMQRSYGVLLVSQFTLYGILKGNKPDFHVAMSPERAKPFYASLVDKFRRSYNPDAVKAFFSLLLFLRSMVHTSTIVYQYTGKCIFYSITYLTAFPGAQFLPTDGIFGAMMKVNLVNDGPVTMQLDSSQTSRTTNDAIGEP
ncbi:uncharacterized protein LOC131312158 isoform X1 [Rhododendron vialii]|uniref:uncharacterized protein LOC131312158 isoform X1 n=1 Tax=Rhododendron vialii TaxID=182163 RepID=UPI00265EAE18|nr:uncharacterized protein LOC131312158 isoform X1 [Rhododendron vialii]